jgi:hypothetical protein
MRSITAQADPNRAIWRNQIEITLTLVALCFTNPAQADTVTLTCLADEVGVTVTIDIDLAARTVCTNGILWAAQCIPARISDRHVVFIPGGQRDDRGRPVQLPITIDRRTQMIRWADGSNGTCQRASGGF